MIEKVLHVTHPFSLRVQKNMEFLGYQLKESKEVPYRRRMNVVCDSSYGFKGKTIYQLTFVIEEDKYNQNKERIDDTLPIPGSIGFNNFYNQLLEPELFIEGLDEIIEECNGDIDNISSYLENKYANMGLSKDYFAKLLEKYL